MAETPEERLARLRREVESNWSPPSVPVTPAGSTPPEPAPPDPAPPAPLDPAASPVPAPAARASAVPPADPVSPMPMPPEPASDPDPDPAPAPPPPPSPASTPPAPRPVADDDGWSLADALGGATLGQWVAILLVVVGGYLLLAQLVPGIAFPGSLVMAAGGLVLLWLHFTHRAGPWGLYAGAILAAVGALRVLGDLMPFNVNGETSLGLGLALVAIGHARHTQAGGYGWQGIVGAVALAWGGIQLALGLLPGAPGVLDLVLPALILGAGVLLLGRTLGRRA